MTSRKKRRHLSGIEIIATRGLPAGYKRFVPMTEGQKDTIKLYMFTALEEIAQRHVTADDRAWETVMAGLLEGLVLARKLDQRDELVRDMKAAARQLSAMRLHYAARGELIEANLRTVRMALDEVSDMQDQFRRDERHAAYAYVAKNLDELLEEAMS